MWDFNFNLSKEYLYMKDTFIHDQAKKLQVTPFEIQYMNLILETMQQGDQRISRAGPTFATFGTSILLDPDNFPILRGRKIYYKGVLGELAAILRGPKHIDDFKKWGCNYWDNWADEDGNINVDYGNAWLDYNGVNQLKTLVTNLKHNPDSRRLIVLGWQPDKLNDLSLPCCHLYYQWFVRESKYLDMIWYQRSVDIMVGLPSDAIFAYVWNLILANQCDYIPGTIRMVFGDSHIYLNHNELAMKYMDTASDELKSKLDTKYILDKTATIDNFTPDMLKLFKYQPAKPLKFELNV